MTISVLGLVGTAALAALLLLAPLVRPDAAKAPTLASKINAACTRPGYEVSDWTTGDEWNPLPPGVVQVTCLNPKTLDTYVVAVTR